MHCKTQYSHTTILLSLCCSKQYQSVSSKIFFGNWQHVSRVICKTGWNGRGNRKETSEKSIILYQT